MLNVLRSEAGVTLETEERVWLLKRRVRSVTLESTMIAYDKGKGALREANVKRSESRGDCVECLIVVLSELPFCSVGLRDHFLPSRSPPSHVLEAFVEQTRVVEVVVFCSVGRVADARARA